MKLGEQVRVVPIDESGEIVKIRDDSRGEPIYDVLLLDGNIHICRACELENRRGN